MSGDREIQNLHKLRDALVELSGSMREWLYLQRTHEGTLPVKDFDELLKSIGGRKSGSLEGEPDKKD
jgi:hypothetical protein